MPRINTPFGRMPLTDKEYAASYDAFMIGKKGKNLEGVYVHATRMLLSLTTTIELLELKIHKLEDDVGDLESELKERSYFNNK